MTDWNAVSAFMANVVAWPGPDDPGQIGLYYRSPNPNYDPKQKPSVQNKPDYLTGWPFRDVDAFVAAAGRTQNAPERYLHIYFCTSRQAKQGFNKRGIAKAMRNAADALFQKSIWIDIDVGPNDPKKYATHDEAWHEFITLRKTLGLPNPSAVVNTGGGFHIYWISKTPLLPQEWHPYADGLKQLLLANNFKFDPTCTADAARILRVPGTANRKYTPAVEAQLLPLPLKLYDFSQLDFLKKRAGQAPAAPAHQLFAEGADIDSFKAGPAFRIDGEPGLEAGIKKFGDNLVDPLPIFLQCGFYKEALLNGGKNSDNPQWNLGVLGTVFMKDGNDVAHKISKEHAGYTPDDTQALYDRKVADRGDRGVGYPSCAAIAGTGSEACKTCPLFPKGKSPLNIRPDAPELTAAVNWTAGDAPQADPSFVDPYAEFGGPEFPLDILPPTLANFVNAEHRAMGADPAAIAMAALTAVAGAMHAETQVRAGDGWWEKPNLWTGLVGLPSSMKSPIIEKATKPLSRIDHERDKCWRQEHTKWAQTPNNQKIPSPPKPARCVINDATAEKVAELLSRDPSGSLMVQDELAGWLGGFERYNTGQSSRAFYLSAWNGGTFLKDRVGKGRNDPDAELRVENLALGILGGIQPDRLIKLGDLTSDGLLQRFLPVLMKPANLGDPYYPVADAEGEYEKLIKSIHGLPAQNYHFADEAFEVRDDVRSYLHRLELVDGFPPSLIGAIGKLNGYFARICLVLHVARRRDAIMVNAGQEPLHPSFTRAAGEHLRKLFGLPPSDCLSAGIAASSTISRETAEAAKKILLEFLLPHMIGLYDLVVNAGQDREKLRTIANFILASDKDRLRHSDFTAGVRGLRGEPEQKIREWVGRFCSMDWLRPEDDKLGVPAKAWLVSAGLRDHFSERRKQIQAARAEMHAILKAGGSRKAS